MKKRNSGCVLLLGLLTMIAAQAQARATRTDDVTVLLFRTAAPQRLHLRAVKADIQLCPACPIQRGPVLLNLQLRGNAMVDDAGKPLRSVVVIGQAEVMSDGGQRANAAGRWTFDVDSGILRARLQVSRERYVEAVLAAEASATEPMESLKALAVVARSFAAAVPERHGGSALCDTTHCQTLRFGGVSDRIREAVWATSGETLWVGAAQVPAYFSQHCGGYTEDAAAVWGGPKQPWLTAHSDAWCVRVPAAWRASLAEIDVRRALAAEGFRFATPLQGIAIMSRDRSGRVQQLQLRSGDAASCTLSASTLRFALNRTLGWNQLRSDRYQIQRVGDHFVFEGTGFGHGVGLCQTGAAEMARAGKSYRDILHQYFPGASVRLQRDDSGWTNVQENGFLLRTVTRDTAFEAEAARAFANARTRWNAPVQGSPSLTIFPTTESFRQATGQPGWELASTQGSSVAAQPAAVLRAHGGTEPVFEHEFLHSFIESEASPAAPLWLREGLAETLGSERCEARSDLSPEAVNEALRHPASLAQSQRAHTAACALAKRIIAEKGIRAARAMLQQR